MIYEMAKIERIGIALEFYLRWIGIGGLRRCAAHQVRQIRGEGALIIATTFCH